MPELFLLVEKNPVNGQEHADGCHPHDVGTKQPENIMAHLGFEGPQSAHISLVTCPARHDGH